MNQHAISGVFNPFQNLYRKCKRCARLFLGRMYGSWGLCRLPSNVSDEGLNPTDTRYTIVPLYMEGDVHSTTKVTTKKKTKKDK